MLTRKSPGSSDSLTIRLDAKTRFALAFVARLRGQTITSVVERAILHAADGATFQDRRGRTRSWQDFWSASVGEREILMADEPSLYPTAEQGRRLAFVKSHPEFFLRPVEAPRLDYLEVLWPRIQEFLDVWDRTKASDYLAAGNAMAEALAEAGLSPPPWPPRIEPPKKD